MKSGDFSDPHTDSYILEEFSKIADPCFTQRIFASRPALVAKKRVNGYRVMKDYHGGKFDENDFDLVHGKWDHEHCSVCFFTIEEKHSYWENKNRITLLCDACYEAFKKYTEQVDGSDVDG